MIRAAIRAALAHVACAVLLACARGYCRVRLAYYRTVIAHLTRTQPTHPDLLALHDHALALDDYLRADYPLNPITTGDRRA